MTGALVALVGLAAAIWGILTATRARRPADIAGALVAALGVALALIGGVAMLVPRFLR